MKILSWRRQDIANAAFAHWPAMNEVDENAALNQPGERTAFVAMRWRAITYILLRKNLARFVDNANHVLSNENWRN